MCGHQVIFRFVRVEAAVVDSNHEITRQVVRSICQVVIPGFGYLDGIELAVGKVLRTIAGALVRNHYALTAIPLCR